MKRLDLEGFDLGALISSCVIALVFICGFFVLAVKLKQVQVAETDKFVSVGESQATRRVQTEGIRGRILDRDGVPLADNRVSFAVVCMPEAFRRKTWDEMFDSITNAIDTLGAAIGRKRTLSDRELKTHIQQSRSVPLVVWRDVGDREVAVVSERAEDFPGFEIVESLERVYPNGSLAGHLLGYVGKERAESLPGEEKFNFYYPEMKGRSGVEYYYNSFLKGVSGEKRLIVDARSFSTREWVVSEPRKGPDLRLTIDSELQRVVESELKGERGACVVLDPRTGDVLAMASAPKVDPNDFVPYLRQETKNRYEADISKPLLNRAAGGAYAPGSIFKPITALAGLEFGFPSTETFDCRGLYHLGQMKLHCSNRSGHGLLDVRHALMKSCNPFFCDLALDIGTNQLIQTAKTFGLGSKTGIDFSLDMAGTVPDGEWKQKMYHEKWFMGDLAHMAIGQGMLLVSPLQMARVAGAIGTGYLVTPHLKFDLESERKKLPFKQTNLDVVRDGMRLVVTGDHTGQGTGRRAAEGVGVAVAGKTGTAEIGLGATRRKNAWFMAYAPADNPTLAVAIVIENGESGGQTAAPKVAAILRKKFPKESTK